MDGIRIEEMRRLEVFEGLSEETIRSLLDIGYKRKYKKGCIVFRDKEAMDSVYIVFSGKFSLYKIGEDGQKRVVYILGSNTILNDDILNYNQSSMCCESFEEGEIFIFKKVDFLKVMERDFELTKVVINSLSVKVRRLYRQLKNTNPNKKIERKIAAKLWKLSKDYGIETEGGVEIGLNITITYLADMFGSQRETVSRALKILEKEELILLVNRKIIVKDRDRLSKYFRGL